jgi:copper chaperone CopZ
MHCDACERRVRKVLENVAGIKVEVVTIGSATLDAPESARPAIVEAIRKAGYEPSDS